MTTYNPLVEYLLVVLYDRPRLMISAHDSKINVKYNATGTL